MGEHQAVPVGINQPEFASRAMERKRQRADFQSGRGEFRVYRLDVIKIEMEQHGLLVRGKRVHTC